MIIHLATGGNRCRDLQPYIRLSSGDPAEEREEELWDPEGSRTSQENSQSQLTWAHRSSRKLNQQTGRLHGSDLSLLHICDSYETWSVCGIPKGRRRNVHCLTGFCTLFLILGHLAQP